MKNCVKKMFYAEKKTVFGRLQISPPIIAKNVFYYRGKTVLASKGGLNLFRVGFKIQNVFGWFKPFLARWPTIFACFNEMLFFSPQMAKSCI